MVEGIPILTCSEPRSAYECDQFPIFFFEECATLVTVRCKGARITAQATVDNLADQSLDLFDDIDSGLGWGVSGDDYHTHIFGNIVNVGMYLGVLHLVWQCYSMITKKRRHGPGFVSELSTPAWWSKKLSGQHRCWEALVERGPTETIPFENRLIVLYLIVTVHLLPLLLVVQRSSCTGFVVSGCFHLVLLAAVVATGANGVMIDKFLQSKLRQCEAQARALGASEAHIEAVHRSGAPEQSVIELLHYLTKTYRQLRRVARCLGADEGQIESALAMGSKSKKAAIILFLLQLREFATDSNTEAVRNSANGKVVNKETTNKASQTQIFVRNVDDKIFSVLSNDAEDLLAKVTNRAGLQNNEVWMS
eukprot:SAG31_NODE_9121_length_1330_cov_1.376929_1_plen_363_part_10